MLPPAPRAGAGRRRGRRPPCGIRAAAGRGAKLGRGARESSAVQISGTGRRGARSARRRGRFPAGRGQCGAAQSPSRGRNNDEKVPAAAQFSRGAGARVAQPKLGNRRDRAGGSIAARRAAPLPFSARPGPWHAMRRAHSHAHSPCARSAGSVVRRTPPARGARSSACRARGRQGRARVCATQGLAAAPRQGHHSVAGACRPHPGARATVSRVEDRRYWFGSWVRRGRGARPPIAHPR